MSVPVFYVNNNNSNVSSDIGSNSDNSSNIISGNDSDSECDVSEKKPESKKRFQRQVYLLFFRL